MLYGRSRAARTTGFQRLRSNHSGQEFFGRHTSTSSVLNDPIFNYSLYPVIMRMGDAAYRQPDRLPVFWQRLREMGVTAGMIHCHADPQPIHTAGVPYYVENMVNKGLCLKFNSNVRDGDKFVTAWKTPRDEAGLVWDYSFDDPAWRDWTRPQMQTLVRKHAPDAPLLYDLRDELSVTHSTNPFAYDLSSAALEGFRRWLKKR